MIISFIIYLPFILIHLFSFMIISLIIIIMIMMTSFAFLSHLIIAFANHQSSSINLKLLIFYHSVHPISISSSLINYYISHFVISHIHLMSFNDSFSHFITYLLLDPLFFLMLIFFLLNLILQSNTT